MKSISGMMAAALLCLMAGSARAEADLPTHAEVDRALDAHVAVTNARARLQIELSEQRKRDSGGYEFTLHGATYRDRMLEGATWTDNRDWEVALERPFRLPNKMLIDDEIGAAAAARGEHGLQDSRHETARKLLQLWFAWQREQAQSAQWQAQMDILQQQAQITEKRIKAGDAPRMELNQVNATAAMSGVSLQQAQLRARLAAEELQRQFPAIRLPDSVVVVEPQAISQPLTYWREAVLEHNHELALVMAEARFQQGLAQRSRADRLPDPTLGLRYVSQLDARQKIGGVYFAIPLGYSARAADADAAEAAARIAIEQEQAARGRIEGDIFRSYTHAVSSFDIWQQAREAAGALKQNAELIARAYSLGESSLDATLVARRQALEATLAETLARLEANEARYRLLLDAHQLWQSDDADHASH